MTAPRPRLAALVVTHNRVPHLQTTVARLLADAVDRVVVVDNGSDDGTQAWLAGHADPRLETLRLPENAGGAGGFAAGLAHVRDAVDPDWVVTMDDDARPLSGSLTQGMGYLDDWDAVAAAVYYPDGSLCEMNRPIVDRRGRQSATGPLIPKHLGPADYASPTAQPVAASSFVGLFVSRKALHAAALPDPALFLYMDDGLYTLGLTRRGLRLGFDPRIRFEHDCQTLAHRMTGFRPLWKAYYYHRNLLLFYRAAMGPYLWPALFYLLPRWVAKVRHQPGERRAYLSLLLRATIDGLRGRRGLRLPPR